MAEDPDSLAWDRVGRFLSDSGSTASYIADRNLKLWSTVSARLRKGEDYKADDMAGDVASVVVAAMDNLDDIWSLLVRSGQEGLTAQGLPTAFLLFRWAGKHRYTLLNPVTIPVGPQFWTMHLPHRAEIEVSARITGRNKRRRRDDTALGTKALAKGARRLAQCLVAIRNHDSTEYILETVNYEISTGPGREAEKTYHGLVPGTYDGLVYLEDPAAALAELLIVVEGKPRRREENDDIE